MKKQREYLGLRFVALEERARRVEVVPSEA